MGKTRALRQQPPAPPVPRATELPREPREVVASDAAQSEAALRHKSDVDDSLGATGSGTFQKKQGTGSKEKTKMGSEEVATSGIGVLRAASVGNRNIQIQIPSSAEYVRVVRLAVLGVASRMPFSYDDVEDIKLAVSEACNNAILHAASEAARTSLKTPDDAADGAKNDAGREAQAHPNQPVATASVNSGDATSGDASETVTRKIEPEVLPADATVVLVTMTPWPDRLEITIADEGFVPPPGLSARVPARLREAPEVRESGLGLFLMQALMDQVEHGTGADSNTVVRLVKYLPRAKQPS
jgi:anti-sigma regulatory factor (Ser/Thr protein kinase)